MSNPPARAMKILAIDDNPDNLTTLKAIAGEALPDCQVLTALGGPQGIELACSEDPDVVLLDIVMPGMDGYEVCRRLKSDAQTNAIPVVFLTALQASRESRVKALDAGAEAFLAKPIDEQELVAQVRAMTRLKAAHRMQRQETDHLATLVAERTAKLQQELVERTRVEDALRASEERYRSILHSALDGFWRTDRQGHLLEVNQAYCTMSGYSEAELLAMSITDLEAVETPAETAARLQRIATKGGARFESRHRRKDGSHFDVQVSVRYRPEDGDSLVVFIADITDRLTIQTTANDSRRALLSLLEDQERDQATMKAAQDRFRDIVNTTDGIVWEADATDFTFTFVSQQAERLFGYPAADWRQPGFWAAHLHPQDKAWATEYCAARTARAESHDFEYRFIAADGRSVWLHDIVTVVAENGAPRWLRGIMVDVTARKNSEIQLQKLSQAVEQSPESIIITNVDAEIEYVNAALLQTTGYSSAELIGKNPRILQSGKTPPETYASLWAALSQGQPWKGELHNRRKDGSEYFEFAIITPLHQADGTISHYVAVKEDITEKKRIGIELDRHRDHLQQLVEQRTAELMLARHQAEAANQAKSSFLANMSHEIRTPMNAIIGLTHLLRHGGTTPQQAKQLDKIDAAGRHLLAIINDILDLSKIDAGKLQLESTNFHLSAVLDHVGSIIGQAAADKDLRIELERDGVPLWLNGDPTRLRQALLNYDRQCRQIHRAGFHRPARPAAACRRRRRNHGAFRGRGYRDRRHARADDAPLPCF